ncbi:glycerophosphodiester phosphodiesterase family protein [Tamlana sp. 2201CG12-4]|uniref:glycerophosphodiester phosphodiesterase family protein n=1 Tax=Tamlana sp. 2201CG12-4 TaxID=3112582 RepID=UPI002DBEEB77|nr:glycerophosphodiester phosphodiesterase family protein [Tamlana sp. 2201CG12-4]MEC3908234.1 glycerophosphodiester phosphodiesterase family protein [Tamlana sp. 2201CG12-4]
MYSLKLKQILVLTLFIGCLLPDAFSQSGSFRKKRKNFKQGGNGAVMVMAHRQDWKNYPENTIESLQSCIDKGIDIVEIDIRKTKDGELVVMHDGSVNRTTNGKGRISDLTLEEIKALRIKDHKGNLTDYTVPSFEEYMAAAKRKIMVNLDIKINALENFASMYKILKKTKTLDHALWVFNAEYEVVKDTLAKYPGVIICPKIGSHQKDPVGSYHNWVDNYDLKTVFFRFKTEQDSLWTVVPDAQKKRIKLYCHTLWSGGSSAGRSDEKAPENPDENWGWLIDNGMEIIMTDEIDLLMDYIKSRRQD